MTASTSVRPSTSIADPDVPANVLKPNADGSINTLTSTSPSSSSSQALSPVKTSIAASDLVIKASAGNLYGANVVSGGTAGYVLAFDASSAPSDGAVTPVKAWVLPANSSLELAFDIPLAFSTGIVISFSSTGPFTKTASATAFISGDAV